MLNVEDLERIKGYLSQLKYYFIEPVEITELVEKLDEQIKALSWPEDAPEWANYLTTDFVGTRIYHSDKPKTLGDKIFISEGQIEPAYLNKDWQTDIITRPGVVDETL